MKQNESYEGSNTQYDIQSFIKDIDENFRIVFSNDILYLTYNNRINENDHILSFDKIIKCMEKYKKVELILINKKIISGPHISMEIDNSRIRVGYPLI